MSANLATVVDYYVERLPAQFRDKPKARATIAILVKQAVADFLIDDFGSAFDIETAVGPQLDVIAKYIGVDRNSAIPASLQFFGLQLPGGGGSSNGFNIAESPLNGFLFEDCTNANLPTTAYTDLQFRFVLKIQTALNHFDGTFAWIQNFLNQFFSGIITVTNGFNFTYAPVFNLDYVISADDLIALPISEANLRTFLPRPMGCGLTINGA